MPSGSEARPCETRIKIKCYRRAPPRLAPAHPSHLARIVSGRRLGRNIYVMYKSAGKSHFLSEWVARLRRFVQVISHMLPCVLGRTKRNRMGNFLGSTAPRLERLLHEDPRFPFPSLGFFFLF